MSVFISWSGDQSKAAALAFRDFLRVVVQNSNPWMSDRDIDAGAASDLEIHSALQSARFGMICVTDHNASSPWLNYEAGALANQVGLRRKVCPVLIGVKKTEVPPPLGRFQCVTTDKEELFKLVQSINAEMEMSVNDSVLLLSFEGQWAVLREALDKAEEKKWFTEPRDHGEMLSEILSIVRESPMHDRGSLHEVLWALDSRIRLLRNVRPSPNRRLSAPDEDAAWRHTFGVEVDTLADIRKQVEELAANLARIPFEPAATVPQWWQTLWKRRAQSSEDRKLHRQRLRELARTLKKDRSEQEG